MKKPIIVVGGTIVIILIALGIALLLQRNGSSNNTGSTTGTLPPVASTTSSTATIPTGPTITLGTTQGGVITNNFYTSAQYITQDQQTVVIQQTSTYVVDYNVGDSSFAIALLSTPLEAARQAAEAELLTSLGISKQDACKLTVYEGVPAFVSDQYVGEDFPLSFCGGPSTL